MSIKNKISNPLRVSLQWIILILLAYMVIRPFVDVNYVADFEAYCPFGGFQALTSFLVNNSLACTMNEYQIFMGVGLLVGVLLFSKLFCSFICPIGTVTEWLAKLGEKFKMIFTLRGVADRGLRILKYALLFITFYFTVGSSELFCKGYDPFYAAFTGFGHDVVLWMAVLALVLTIVGSIFIRQFWCKYLCPLGALTNIFTNGIMFVVVLGVYIILRLAGLEISWIWPAAIMTVAGFVLETWRMEGWIFPPFKITRNEDTCTSCGDCDLSCPMGIEISESTTVKHIDCHLCGACLHACPIDQTLQINKRNLNWLPAAATVILVAIGFWLATTVELPTINERWGAEEKFNTAAIYSQSGLKSVKCYGSSMSFASKMKRVAGVLGVETYVRSHTVKVFYDSSEVDVHGIRKSIFSASKTMLRKPQSNLQTLAEVEMGIEKLFDSYDNFYFSRLLAQVDGVYGYTTTFGEPVPARIFFDSLLVSPQRIKEGIEKPVLTYKSRGKDITVDVNFGVSHITQPVKSVTRQEFITLMFTPFDQAFNKFKTYKPEQLAIYQVPMPQAANPRLRRSLSYLMSHISSDDNVVRFQTVYEDQPYARIWFVKDSVPADSILTRLQNPQLTVHYRGGKTGQVKNPFKFTKSGKIVE